MAAMWCNFVDVCVFLNVGSRYCTRRLSRSVVPLMHFFGQRSDKLKYDLRWLDRWIAMVGSQQRGFGKQKKTRPAEPIKLSKYEVVSGASEQTHNTNANTN